MILMPCLEFVGFLVERDARNAFTLCFILEEGEERMLLVLTDVVPVFFFKLYGEPHGVLVVRILGTDFGGEVHDEGQ